MTVGAADERAAAGDDGAGNQCGTLNAIVLRKQHAREHIEVAAIEIADGRQLP